VFDQIGDGDRQANRSNVLCIEAFNDVAREVNTSRYELFATSVSHISPSRDIKALCCENRHKFFSFFATLCRTEVFPCSLVRQEHMRSSRKAEAIMDAIFRARRLD
jgi:hypothetical protein